VFTGPPQVHPGVGLVSHQIAVHLYDLPAVGSGVTIGYPRWWPRSRCCGRGGLPPRAEARGVAPRSHSSASGG
jgi:hypothetical protein